jgi:hypothetical protein
VAWVAEGWPGISGSCFLVRAFGKTFAVTARHTFGKSEPYGLRVPKEMVGPIETDWLVPDGVYWYNADTEYDHIADVAIAGLPELVGPALEFVAKQDDGVALPGRGDRLVVVGYPRSHGEIRYWDLEEMSDDARRRAAALGVTGLVSWGDAYVCGATYDASETGDYHSLDFDESVNIVASIDGMSGSPVFRVEPMCMALAAPREDWRLVGMLVRGTTSSRRGYFIGVNSIRTKVIFAAANLADARGRQDGHTAAEIKLALVVSASMALAEQDKELVRAANQEAAETGCRLQDAVLRMVMKRDPDAVERLFGAEIAGIVVRMAREKGVLE